MGFVSGMIPILKQYCDIRKKRELQTSERTLVESALKELAGFLVVDGTRMKNRQKLLRNLRVVEVLIDMLRVPFKPENTSASAVVFELVSEPEHAGTKSICNLVYCVLKAYLEGNSRKNELYMARHVAFFQHQVGGGLDVGPVYTELVRDNGKIVANIGKKEIAKFIDLLHREKHYQYLDFLAVLCVCEDAPLGLNQSQITKMLLEDSKDLVYLTELQPKGGVSISMDGGSRWEPLVKFVESAMDEDDSTSTPTFLFLQKQLELFGKLCLGRNTYAWDVIAKKLRYLTWEECFHCATDVDLPKSLRALYVALISNLFVDTGDNRDILAEVQLTYVWNDLAANPYASAAQDPTESLSGARMEYFPQLAEFIRHMIHNNTSMVVSDRPTNLLMVEVLRLLSLLVSFGYYASDADITALMKELVEMADGTNDLPHPKKKVQFAEGKSNETAVVEWRRKDRYTKSANNKVAVSVKGQALDVIGVLFNFVFTVRLQRFIYDFKSVCNWTGDHSGKSRRDPAGRARAMGNTMSADHMRALQLLIQTDDEEEIFQQTPIVRDYMQRLLESTNWLVPGHDLQMVTRSPTQVSSLVDILFDLSRYDYSFIVSKSMQLLNRFYSVQSDIFRLAIQAQVILTQPSREFHSQVNLQVSIIRRLTAGYVETDEAVELIDILRSFGDNCVLADEPSRPHRANQDILLNSGVLSLLYDVLQSPQDGPVVAAVFQLLYALGKENKKIQRSMFGKLDLFLRVSCEDDGWQNSMAATIAEIFNSNEWTCLRLSADQVDRMFQFLVKNRIRASNMLDALRGTVKLEDMGIPLKRNQLLIIKYLMQFRQQLVAVALIDDKSSAEINRQRIDLLRHGKQRNSAQRNLREYHLKLVSLLAACAEGENRFIESMCQTIFTVQELLETIADRAVPAEDKGPYLSFFLWAYLRTDPSGGDSLEDLGREPLLFQGLEQLAQDVLPRCYAPVQGVAQNISEELQSLIFDSFLPVVTMIIKEYYDESSPPNARSSLVRVGKLLSPFITRSTPFVFNHLIIKTMSACATALRSVDWEALSADAASSLQTKLTSMEAGMLESNAQRQYRDTYCAQEDINNKFNAFACNIAKAFQGRNTVAAQLSLRSANTEPYCDDEGGNMALPLGLPFQALVSLFVERQSGIIAVDDVKSLARLWQALHRYGATLKAQERARHEETDIKMLQVTRALLHNRALVGQDVKVLQKRLADCQVLAPVVEMLSSLNDEVVQAALGLLSEALKDGNRAAQLSFEHQFLSTREESFFIDIRDRMRRSLDSVQQLRALRRQINEHTQQPKETGTMTLAGALGAKVQLALEAESRQAPSPLLSEDDGMELQQMTGKASGQSTTNMSTPELNTKDENSISLVLSVLKGMCEGHNNTLQNYLRSQPDNIRSVDLVAETARFAHELSEDIDADNIELVTQTMDTLVEFAQGCEANQRNVFDLHIVDMINYVLRMPLFPGCSEYQEARLKLSCAQLVMSMLENNDALTNQMAKELDETLDMPALFRAMHKYEASHGQHTDHDWPDLEARDVAFALFLVPKRLHDFTNTDYASLERYAGPLKASEGKDPVFADFEKETVSIEIMRHGGLHRIHFHEK